MLAALGGRVVWHAENDSRAARVLSRHWPGIPNHGDVTALDWADVEPVDVLTAGFPCQGLSVAGPRTGLAPGTRSGLWHHLVTGIEALAPALVVIENVRGILSTRTDPLPCTVRDVEPCPRCLGDADGQPRMRALGTVLSGLADRGYDCAWTCVQAADVGAPHRRSRTFLIAWPTTTSASATAVEDPDGQPGQQRRLPAPHQTQSGRARAHSGRRGRAPAAHPESQRRHEGVTASVLPQRHPDPRLHRRHAHPTPAKPVARVRPSASDPDHQRFPRWCGHHPQTPRRHEPPNCRHSPAQWWAEYLPAIRRWEDATGHPAPPPTVPGTRRLSAEFVEWMMLPKGWVTATEGLTRAAQLHLLGNSVVPQQATRALKLLLATDAPCHASRLRGGVRLGGAE
ncbi:DNA cytosine methyltransferase [Streptomyces sp. 21So2-11]|uniref:DNA cytosine methyltransferase n=1 Tax=Streptomyces sp. 21So2-11 TaxID=3144408 RepID=UPI00321A4AEB